MEERPLAPELTDQDRLLLVFSYLGPLALFALVATRKEFVKWHAKQGMVLLATFLVLWVPLRALYLVLKRVAWPMVGDLFWLLVVLVGVGVLLTLFLCAVRALEGERFRVPVFGDLADRF
jgi:uncharacterized membrane protein